MKKQINLMKKKRIRGLFGVVGMILLVLTVGVFSAVFASAQTASFCCEKTTTGAYCQNAPQEMCDIGIKNPASGENYKIAPTSCESTSYCKKGCCYDSNQGTCAENVPEGACISNGGLWEESPDCSIPKCAYGCCILGTEAAFVTLQTCKKISGTYGLLTDFRGDVQDEYQCLALATSQEVGACVYEEDFANTCKFTTRGQCNEDIISEGLTDTNSVKFYKGLLCTAEKLGTDCQRTSETTCKDGKVYFLDTCGNTANIYDGSKIKNVEYWTNYHTPDESCSQGGKDCGNCEYIGAGTYCMEGSGASYGDYICGSVNCKDTSNGKDYKNGASWCYYDDKGNENTDSVGSRHYRHICYMGEEIVEPCADFRNEVCVEESIGEEEDFPQAGCAPNKFQDCLLINRTRDCLNKDKRDCVWVPFDLLIGAADGKNFLDKERILAEALNVRIEDEENGGRCVPNVAPGFEFWETGAENDCGAGDYQCVVKYEKGLLSDKKCVENCWCEEPKTAAALGLYCSMLGDCGPGKNYVGRFVNEGYEIIIGKEGKEKPSDETESKEAPPAAQPEFKGSQGGEFSVQESKPAATSGNVIKNLVGGIFGKA